MPRTIWWEDNQVKMIDQRILPLHYEVLGYTDYHAVAAAITDMVVRGAPAIGAAGGFGMALAARQSRATDRDGLLADLAHAKAVLDAARPTAVNLSWATARVMELARRYVPGTCEVPGTLAPGTSGLIAAILAEAQRIADEDVEINRRMGAFGAEIVPQTAEILTHCNAGALATVDYGTTLGVVRAALEQGKRVHVWVDETRPRLQGAKLTAWELQKHGIEVMVIADTMAGSMMRKGKIDACIVGADRIAANGDVANKIGTYQVAVLAKRHAIPFYVAAPLSTIDPKIPDGDAIPIEERDPAEVTHIGATQITPDFVEVANPSFDVTPAELVTAIITERGVLTPPFPDSIAALFERP